MYIKTNWDNPYFLNRCPDGDTTKGMRPYNGYIKPIPKLKGIPEYMKPKKVAVFSNDGDLIEITKSKSELERKYKIKHNHVNHIINGEREKQRNYKIKMVDDLGNVSDEYYITYPYSIAVDFYLLLTGSGYSVVCLSLNDLGNW